jgi:catechol 2,3-dioxygenase-like lactoylglutathione lyase family enzyme
MNNGIAGIDHVIVGVRNLERARLGWTRLGFTLTPRGRHIGQGTANYCIMFRRDYIELLGFVERDEFGHRLEAFLAQREGPMSVAFAPVRNAGATREALLSLGLHPGKPRALGRALELPEGAVTPRFTLLTLPAEETPALDCFVCGHLTPELVRRPSWLSHSNGVSGIKSVTLLVAGPAALKSAYARLAGAEQTAVKAGTLTVKIGRHRLNFTTADKFRAMHPDIAIPADFPTPGIVALELAVRSRKRTAAYLQKEGVVFDELSDGRLAVAPGEANGTVILLADA